MHTETTFLPLTEQASGGCGCGCNHTEAASSTDRKERDMGTEGMGMETVTQTYSVTGMTCGHCVQAVTSELEALEGVRQVSVDLNADGMSSVTVVSAEALTEATIQSGLTNAGGYQLTL